MLHADNECLPNSPADLVSTQRHAIAGFARTDVLVCHVLVFSECSTVGVAHFQFNV